MILLLAIIFGIIGAPIFGIILGATQAAWLSHDREALQVVRFIAPDVLDDRFAGSPILVTIPLFTFIGYMMAESKTPDRIVRAAQAMLGWMPGGLAIVCILASAFFTTFTGGSAVTIVAIGALLYPSLLAAGYPQSFALGVIMTSGSVGLLLPPSLPILVYSLVAGIDFTKGFKSGIAPGFVIILLLSLYSVYIALKHKVPRQAFAPREALIATWVLKWEIGVPVLVLAGLGTGLMQIDESAAVAAVYASAIEVYVYKDLSVTRFIRIVRNAIALAGALLLIMASAMALTNFIISEQIPSRVYAALTEAGVRERWQFLVVLNMFLYFQGMVMDGFSTILVTVPLLIPFAAQFTIQPFHMAMMFLVNMEIGYLSPPLGQNLFVTSFRFNRPMTELYKICVPFLLIMILGLVIIVAVPGISTFAVAGDIAEARAKAAAIPEAPRDAWLMECVQEDRNNPLPCTEEDKKKWGVDGRGVEPEGEPEAKPEGEAAEEAPADDDLNEDDLMKDFQEALGKGDGAEPSAAPSAEPGGAPSAAPSSDPYDDLFKEMTGE